jgi:MFS family permease
VIGGPLSGALLGLDGWLGLRGWQWLFLLEGIPSVLVGVAVLWLLPDRPRDARWLPPAEREWLEERLEAERGDPVSAHGASLRRALADPLVWWLGLSYFLLVVALYGFALWLPQLVKAGGDFSNFEVGVITAIPYAVAAVGMVLVGRSSDRTGERHLHLALPALAGALGFVAVTRSGTTGFLIAALSLAAFGVLGWLGPFWALPTAFLREQAAAGGIALINSMGAVGGFVRPYFLGGSSLRLTKRDRLRAYPPVLRLVHRPGHDLGPLALLVGGRDRRKAGEHDRYDTGQPETAVEVGSGEDTYLLRLGNGGALPDTIHAVTHRRHRGRIDRDHLVADRDHVHPSSLVLSGQRGGAERECRQAPEQRRHRRTR